MGTVSFAYTGAWRRWVVPAGVKRVSVELNGAGSGSRPGGRVSGSIDINPGQSLYVMVGAMGKGNVGATGGAAVFGGGARGGTGRGRDGGNSGGGATAIRLGSTTGVIKAVAGGAGGDSGDGGKGGRGGAAIGENGFPATTETGQTENATGGTQIQGGNGGTSSVTGLNGANATDTALSPGGVGCTSAKLNTYGGGGGGGGYRAGGGGQAGLVGYTPGGGGGGGSNYTGGLSPFSTAQGTGGTGNGDITLTWVNPAPANQPPTPPTDPRVNNVQASPEMITRATSSVGVSATLDDPNRPAYQKVRLVVYYSTKKDHSSGVRYESSELVEQTKRGSVVLSGLSQNTHYYLRLYARDSVGLRSVNYTAVDFWTNRSPTMPTLTGPYENQSVPQLGSTVFTWNHNDPDDVPGTSDDPQRVFELRLRVAATSSSKAGAWTTVSFTTPTTTYVRDPNTLSANVFYDWQVRTRDRGGLWSPWSFSFQFFVTGTSTFPILTSPTNGEAVDISVPVMFTWKFRDPDAGNTQTKADLRYRPINPDAPETWFIVDGDITTPGADQFWEFAPEVFQAGVNYEYQVRTYDSDDSPASDFSEPENFWAIRTPGSGIEDIVPEFTQVLETLGCGNHRAFLYDRGGQVLRGEIKPLEKITWSRKRDDISNCLLTTNGFDEDCGELLRSVRAWAHEIVVFRDGVRVWEGPVTRVADSPDGVEIEAKDVMAYVYRRIMRQGYNDSYRVVNGEQLGQRTVVERAALIAVNALAPDDPNVLPYLTTINFPDDAGQSRIVPDYSKTAWEEIDDLAATAGLDYVTVGRRILLWDVHRPVGRLTEWRDEHFSDPPLITQYGMQFATDFAVSNNSGVYGLSKPRARGQYGLIEQIASAYGETEADAAGADATVLTREARAEIENTLERQAERNIAHRYPIPMIVRVPDNSTLQPTINLGINQLIPGVWVPLRCQGVIFNVAQWQKLDLVTVEQDASGEKITVTLSPAPNGGEDPDAEQAEGEE